MLVKRHFPTFIELFSQVGPESSQDWLKQCAYFNRVRLWETANLILAVFFIFKSVSLIAVIFASRLVWFLWISPRFVNEFGEI